MKSQDSIKCARGCWKSFCIVFFCKKNLARDLIILAALVMVLGAILSLNLGHDQKIKGESVAVVQEVPVLQEEEAVVEQEVAVGKIQAKIDTTTWTSYQNTWYGFSLKYPNDWMDPVAQKAQVGSMWEQKINFRTKQSVDENPFEGFDVVIYSVAKVKELSQTDEYPKLKNSELSEDPGCLSIEGHLLETGEYPAEEIYLPITDACYNAALFFSNTRENYIYNIAPKLKEGMGLAGDPAREITQHMPEFFSVASDWNLINIQRPKPVPPKPKITAPKPVSFKKDNLGRLVCANKNDKPGKSKQNKGKHLDMECCLDPDEYPNPWCYYPPEKYGKYL